MGLFSLGEKSPRGKDSQCVVVRVCPGARIFCHLVYH